MDRKSLRKQVKENGLKLDTKGIPNTSGECNSGCSWVCYGTGQCYYDSCHAGCSFSCQGTKCLGAACHSACTAAGCDGSSF